MLLWQISNDSTFITFIVVVDLITTVPATLSPGKKVLDGDLSFISKTVDDIVIYWEN